MMPPSLSPQAADRRVWPISRWVCRPCQQTERLKPPHPYSLCEHTDRMTILHSFLCRRKSMSLPLSGKRFTMGCSFTWRFQR